MNMPNHNPFCNGIVGKAVINETIYEVVELPNYQRISSGVKDPAVIINDEYIVPVKGDTSKGYGISLPTGAPFVIAKLPEETSKDFAQYTVTGNTQFNDWRNIHSMSDYAAASEMQHSTEVDIITSPDNIFKPAPTNEDSPAMHALKEAVCDKNIDIDKYSMRFGSNFNNDKRLFNKNTISIQKLTRLCDRLDIKATLTLEDVSPKSPNPMGRTITVELTNGEVDLGGDNDDE